MGQFAFHSGIVGRLYKAVNAWIGHRPGGLAVATMGACGAFAAISSSSLATAATMGAVALPEMKKYGYDSGFATGCVAAGGTLGILIPPSGVLIMYGIMTETSIGRLFMCGVLPGILLMCLFIITVMLQVIRKPQLAPAAERVDMRARLATLPGVIDMGLLIVLVFGGLWGGLFTPNEAGAVGAAGALIIALARRKLRLPAFLKCLSATSRTTAMIMAIVIGAMIFNRFLAISQLPAWLATTIEALDVPLWVIWVGIIVMYAFLGCIFDSGAIVLLTVPILFPVVSALGIDPYVFGIVIVIMAEMGLITPPVGMNVYVIAGIAPDVPMGTIFRGVIPYIAPMTLCVIIVIVFPPIVTALMNLLY
jgi:C4-dicarboxylate transporter DctM subunit